MGVDQWLINAKNQRRLRRRQIIKPVSISAKGRISKKPKPITATDTVVKVSDFPGAILLGISINWSS